MQLSDFINVELFHPYNVIVIVAMLTIAAIVFRMLTDPGAGLGGFVDLSGSAA